ncbi:phage tail protein [Kordiimonas sp.]|uniref:phage tail protein n=1 Tax=Kordiimonas sp. TaxID=1970157 RepID=UPI003A8F247C
MGLFSFLGGLLGLPTKPASQGIKISKASAVAGLPIIYGRQRVTPVKVYKTVSRHNAPPGSLGQYDHTYLPDSSDDEEVRKDYDWLHRIDVWGQGEITGIDRFWIDGDLQGVKRFKKKPYFRALSKYGSESQTAMTALSAASDVWTSAHRGRGVAYSWLRFFNSEKKPQFTAEPEVKALVRGLRVYDPRQSGQSFSNPATWQYSNNRALVILNYLMAPYGFNAGEDEIDIDSFITAANKCDEMVSIPSVLTNTSPTPRRYWDRVAGEFVFVSPAGTFPGYRDEQVATTQQRWLADAVIDPKKGVIPNLKKLLEGFGWSMPWSNGKHRLVIEDVVDEPVMTFGADDITGGWKAFHGARDGMLTRVTVEFPNANKDFEEDAVSWPKLDSTEYASYLAQDQGKENHTNVPLETITDYYRARQYAEFLVRKSRVSHRIEGLKLARKAMLLEPGDVIAIDYPERGFDGRKYIVEKVSVTAFLEVSVDLALYESTVYEGGTPEQEPLNSLGDLPDLWLEPPELEDLQLVSFHEAKADGSVISGLDVNWDAPIETIGIDRFELKWRKAGEATYTGQQYLPRDTLNTRISGLVDGLSYDVRVTYWTQRGQESEEAVQTIELPATPSKLDDIEDGATRNDFRGAYDDFTTYSRGDVVTYEGSSYVFKSMSDAVGVEPTHTTYWTLLAAAGPEGPQGNPGPEGPQGPQGTSGETYHIVSVQGLRWGFANNTVQGWSVPDGSGSISASAGLLHFTGSSSTDPKLQSPNNLNANGRLYSVVRVVLANSGATTFTANPQIYYSTAGHGYDASHYKSYGSSVTFDPGKTKVLYFDMHELTAGGDDWRNGTIKRIRFDIANKANLQIEIEGIVIGQRDVTDITSDSTLADLDLTANTKLNEAKAATESLGSLATLSEVTQAEIALNSASWYSGGNSGTKTITNAEVWKISGTVDRPHTGGQRMQLLWNPRAKCNSGTVEQVSAEFFRRRLSDDVELTLETISFFVSNQFEPRPMIFYYQPGGPNPLVEALDTTTVGLKITITDGSGSVIFEPAIFSLIENSR